MIDSTNGVSDARRQKVVDMYAAIDRKDVETLVGLMAPDGTQRFGNAEPLRGHDEIREGNLAFLGSVATISHNIVGLWESAEGVVVRLQVTYGRHDGHSVTIPAVTIFTEQAGMITDFQVFMDAAPVFAPIT